MKTIGIVGNPNCGKTTVFNALTGAGILVAMFGGFYLYGRKHKVDMV